MMMVVLDLDGVLFLAMFAKAMPSHLKWDVAHVLVVDVEVEDVWLSSLLLL